MGVRLPRGTGSRFSFGDDESLLEKYGWFSLNAYAYPVRERYARPVGLKQPYPWGLHDMHGNVWEWCRDWYVDQLPGGIDPDVQEEATARVDRGGGWYARAGNCRSASRDWNSPDDCSSSLGFRVAMVQTR